MTGAMQCYAELTTPTAVTHSVSLPFLSANTNNLILIKSSLLQIFSLKSATDTKDEYQTENDKPLSANVKAERIQSTKLVLIAEYELAGTVTSLARVKIQNSKSGGEAVLVALRDAKLSLIEWDPEKYNISTISIHYYEREDLIKNPWEQDLAQCGTILTVDPNSRCAVFKFGIRHVAILPFHQAGDDIAMDDFDSEEDEDAEKQGRKSSITKADEKDESVDKTPYAASFVLSLLALDPVLKNPVHLTFLHEYREPTFGVLSSQSSTSTSLLSERKDILSYTVYSLDLEQRASTTLLSVTNLPHDLTKIVPLSRAIGGALLLGANELIHVDQSGKTNGIAINEAAKHCTSFPLSDQSRFDLRLESCLLKQLGSDIPEILIIEPNGSLFVLSFKIDGRSVSGLNLRRVDDSPLYGTPSCASSIGRGRMFVGGEQSNSVVIGWSRPSDRLKRQKSRQDVKQEIDEAELTDLDELDFDDEDDLYADDKPNGASTADKVTMAILSPEDDYKFRVHDVLPNIAPLRDVALGQYPSNSTQMGDVTPVDELMTTSGQGQGGSLVSLETAIHLRATQEHEFPEVGELWSLKVAKSQDISVPVYDTYVAATVENGGNEIKTKLYTINQSGFDELQGSDFDADAGTTIEFSVFSGSSKLVQVLEKEVRVFDAAFSLLQIIDLDEDSTSAVHVVRASFADPYILLLNSDKTITIIAQDETGDLEILESSQSLAATLWQSGSLYDDANDVLRLEFGEDDEASNVLMFLLTDQGGMRIYRLPSLQKPIYVADGLSFLPPFLSEDFNIRRSSAREPLAEIMVTELGDAINRAPYLLLRTASDDFILYQPYQSPIPSSRDTALRFLKLSTAYVAPASSIEDPMDADGPAPKLKARPISFQDLDGYSGIYLPVQPPQILLKPSISPPRLVPLSLPPNSNLIPLSTPSNPHGLAYTSLSPSSEASALTLATLPRNQTYTSSLPTTIIPLKQTVEALTFHPPSKTYVLSLSTPTTFALPKNDPSLRIPPPASEPQYPTTSTSSIALFTRITNTITQSISLSPSEIVLTMTVISLSLSDSGIDSREDCVVIGTTVLRGEDLASIGRLYIYRVVTVVPDPDHPHPETTTKALRLLYKEELKGAVTAVSSIGTQGFLMIASGQKLLVKGFKGGGSGLGEGEATQGLMELLPVAFLDTRIMVSVCKELRGPVDKGVRRGTGLICVGDVLGGVWFVGYTEDPYQLRLFAKSPFKFSVVVADFLPSPSGKELSIVAGDSEGNWHVLSYDPENPTSLSGTLLTTSTPFSTPHFPSTLTLIPPTISTSNPTSVFPPNSLLTTSTSGTVALITPLPENNTRTLTSLSSHLLATLPTHLGLNPRAFRSPSDGGEGEWEAYQLRSRIRVGGQGGVLDGNLLGRWREMGRWRWWGGEDEGVVRGAVKQARAGIEISSS